MLIVTEVNLQEKKVKIFSSSLISKVNWQDENSNSYANQDDFEETGESRTTDTLCFGAQVIRD